VQRVLVREVQVAYRVAERRACRVLGFSRTTYRYRSRRNPRAELRVRLRDLAASRVQFGYPRLWVLLRREGWLVNKKLVYRLYCEEGLGIRRKKPRRRKSVQVREARSMAQHANDSWSMDFVSDQLVGGQRFRLLTLVDNHSRESLAIWGRSAIDWRRCCEGFGGGGFTAWQATNDSSRQRTGVHFEELGSVGLLQRREARLQQARKANG